jgi:phosphoserine phosphatase RsbU/P
MINIQDPILETKTYFFTTLAKAWIASGASSLEVLEDGQTIFCCPPEAVCNLPVVSAKFEMLNGTVGELRLSGLDRAFVEAPLKAEAQLLNTLFELDFEANQMTEELMTARDHLVALYKLNQATRNCLELDNTLAHLSRETKTLLKGEYSIVSIAMPDEPKITTQYPFDVVHPDLLEVWQMNLSASTLPYIMFEQIPIPGLLGVYNVLLVQLPVHGSLNSLFCIIRKGEENFKSPSTKLAVAIADFAVAHIENIFLVQEKTKLAKLHTEMELAKRVQLSLLPKNPPYFPGIDVWAASSPASQVGGDFYDFLVRPGQSFTFMVGDISGKGLSAALLMGMIRTMLRTQVSTLSHPTPEAVISLSNTNLYSDFTELSRFVTVFMGQYEVQSRQLIYANAGHSPVIYYPRGGRAGMLKADGTAMGVLPESQSRNQHLILQNGDVLIIGTDGMAEASNNSNSRFGYQRLLEITEKTAHLTAQEIGNAFFQELKEFSIGAPQEDDQTLVVLKCIA